MDINCSFDDITNSKIVVQCHKPSMYALHLIAAVISLLNQVKCARILSIFPGPAISHQMVLRSITHELAKRGHEVVVITPNPAFSEAPGNLTEIDVSEATYEVWNRTIFTDTTAKTRDEVTDMVYVIENSYRVFERAMQTPAVKDIISKREHFDLLLTEHSIKLSLGFSHIIKAPVVQISSLGDLCLLDTSVGSEKHPFVYPYPFHRRVYNLTTLEKIQTLWNGLKLFSAYKSTLRTKENEIAKIIFGPDTPPLWELENNVHLNMLNVHPMWTENQPIASNVILIGGVNESPPRPLPQDLQTRLDSSTNGTIYVSFGSKSRLSDFESETVRVLLDVLCKMPFDVLLKWDEEKLPIDCGNIHISKWFPQADVLRHPKVKLFVTQGGLQSTDEAIAGAVPLLGVPVMGDQFYNAEKYERHRIGRQLRWSRFDEHTFRDAIETIINDKSYYENIARLRRIMRDTQQTPLERAVWWVEYVLRHGGAAHLRAPSAHLSLYQYLEVDLLVTILFSLLILILVLLVLIYLIVKYIKRKMLREKEKIKLF